MIGGKIPFEKSTILATLKRGEQKVQDKIDRLKLQVESAGKKQPMPLNPLKPSKRFNPNTGKIEVVQ
jgi:hypothetical protein